MNKDKSINFNAQLSGSVEVFFICRTFRAFDSCPRLTLNKITSRPLSKVQVNLSGNKGTVVILNHV